MKKGIYLLRPKILKGVSLALILGSVILPPMQGRAMANGSNLSMDEIFQAQAVISGKVISATDGLGLPGVTILEKGTTNGTVSDIDGNYSLNVNSASAVLVFSYIGFNTVELPVNGQSTLNLTMEENIESLGEVVVTALGIEREKRSLGYSVGEVKGEDMRTVTQENALGSLAGRVAGVQINQTSGTGSSTSVVIRGATSLSSDNQPLFVIDGVPVANSLGNVRTMGDRNQVDYGNPIADLSPDDIEDMTVLKGPSAAALYGSRAGNGVILITTKKGKKGEAMRVNFSTSNVFETPYRFLDMHYQYANGSRTDLLDERSAYWSGPKLDVGNKAVQWNSPTDASGNKIATDLNSYADNMKNFLETGITSTNALSVSGATDKAVYRLSYSNMINKGMIPNTDLNRHSINFSNSYSVTPKLNVSADINVSRNKSDNRPTTGNRGANPLEAVYAWSHVDIRELKDYWVPGQEEIQQKSVSPNNDNPYFLAYGVNNGFERDRIFGNLKTEYKFSDAVKSHVKLTMDTYSENRETKIPYSYTRERKGAYHLQTLGGTETNVEFMTSYNKRWENLTLNVSGGGNIMSQHYNDAYMGSKTNAGLIVPGLYRISNIPNTGLNYSNYSSEKSIYSVFGIASFGFKDQLYADITARNDWSSTLPADNRSYFYPSLSLSWLANYTFNLPESISMLKLRAGIAQAGNDTYPYALEQQLGTGSWGSLITTNYPGTLLNPNLKPEISTSKELGLDMNFLDNRIRFEATYYYQSNENQILSIPTPESSGYSQRQVNAGLISSKGWEIQIGATPIQKANGLTWDVNFNITRNRTTLEELTEGMEFITLWEDNGGGASTFVGGQIGDLYSRGFATVEDKNSPYYGWPILSNNGEWISKNDRADRRKVGNFNPDAMLGFQTSLSYKRFVLSASVDARMGGDFMSFTYRYAESDWKSGRQKDMLIPGGNYTEQELIDLLKSNPGKYIIPQNGAFPRVGGYSKEEGGMDVNQGPEGDDGAFIPGVIMGENGEYIEHLGGPGTNIYPISDTYPWSYNEAITFDASFVKLRELALTYTLPKLKGFQNASVSLFTRNLMLWTKADVGIDPERAFQLQASKQGDSANLFRQGIELQNVNPWTMPLGFKFNANF
ncbi:SusC/RagA family TonB-linked outer membrane protein [Algoriphagus sp. A40]|uniref:SusC/RagA family TonB-linked outer membrane protein n=1 Tax=Algoriphagus sp. A40 TaxID=1945863 RepID=UPI000985EA05|nr:SusC/RagA family TonB-linked outer membrane protein [Algoriphagus sp. A40]OOG77121.1 SusC/RagA family TonB-linked outer membrane protein [Algoriphagus sp. A40]